MLIILDKNAPPMYEWVPFETSEEESYEVSLAVEGGSIISKGFGEFQLTVTNGSPYQIRYFLENIDIQKFENDMWYSFQQAKPPEVRTSNGLLGGNTLSPSESRTYNFLLVEAFPLALQRSADLSGEYRLYVPFGFEAYQDGTTEIFGGAYATIPITIIDD